MIGHEHFPSHMFAFDRVKVQLMIKTAQIKNKDEYQNNRKGDDSNDSSIHLADVNVPKLRTSSIEISS
jgi:hypothetical protein